VWVKICLWIFLLFHTITDIKWKKINVIVCFIYAIGGVIFFVFREEKDMLSMLGGVFAGAFLLVFSLLTKEAVGIGDGCVVTAAGIWLGGGRTLAILMGGFIFTALFGVVKICLKKATGKSEIAFVPFFTLSYMVLYLGGVL